MAPMATGPKAWGAVVTARGGWPRARRRTLGHRQAAAGQRDRCARSVRDWMGLPVVPFVVPLRPLVRVVYPGRAVEVLSRLGEHNRDAYEASPLNQARVVPRSRVR